MWKMSGLAIFIGESETHEIVGTIRILPRDSVLHIDIRSFEVRSGWSDNDFVDHDEMRIAVCVRVF